MLAICTGLASGRFSHDSVERFPHAAVRRADLTVILRAGGLVESSLRTVIRCELENLGGKRLATTILDLVPAGSIVKKGDVLCRLDASEYEELERHPAHLRRPGPRRIGDAPSSTWTRHRDRLGGISGRQSLAGDAGIRGPDRAGEGPGRPVDRSPELVADDAGQGLPVQGPDRHRGPCCWQQAEFALARVESEFRSFQEFQSPTMIRSLESQVESARSNLTYQSMRFRGQEERLARLRRQVASCTIRAPHDGLLIYAHKPKRGVRIEEGAGSVRTRNCSTSPTSRGWK